MTTQESFKKRIRARMVKSGERYTEARRALLAEAGPRKRRWQSEPEVGDTAVSEATGRDWEAWCDHIDAWPGRDDGHTAIAAWLAGEQGVELWWAQTITVGYERISGRRLPYQKADGTFTAQRSRTLDGDAALIGELLRSPDAYPSLFPGLSATCRSRATSKTVRIASMKAWRFSPSSIGPMAAVPSVSSTPGCLVRKLQSAGASTGPSGWRRWLQGSAGRVPMLALQQGQRLAA